MAREERADPRDLDDLASDLYATLRAIADRVVGPGDDRVGIRPTELVHECYLRLSQSPDYATMKRQDFLALAARVIRNLLVDQARRAGMRHATTLAGAELASITRGESLDLLSLDDAMRRLAHRDERQARIVELKFFAGLTGDEIATLFGLTRRTITKEWGMARAWLRRELEG